MIKVLFICKGNVARSQMAEAMIKKLGRNLFESSSAGTKLSGPEQSLKSLQPLTDDVINSMSEIGFDVLDVKRKQLTEEMINSFDKIVVIMEEFEDLPEYLSRNHNWTRWAIPDPKGKGLEFTSNVRDRILVEIKSLIGSES